MVPATLHRYHHPHTLALLDTLLGHRTDAAGLGYETTSVGARVDWERLTTAPLSVSDHYVAVGALVVSHLETFGTPAEAARLRATIENDRCRLDASGASRPPWTDRGPAGGEVR
jgi:hypothetical protein